MSQILPIVIVAIAAFQTEPDKPAGRSPDSDKPAKPSAAAPSADLTARWSAIDFSAHFGGLETCVVLREIGGPTVLRHNPERCRVRLTPCSTFKIPNALIGLETGVLSGPDHLMKWDGKPQWIESWERDHTLATAIRDSVLWYFQNVAEAVGMERMTKFIDAIDYGNRDLSGGIRRFWLESTLKISADEQAAFVEKLYTGRLPFAEKTVGQVKQMLVRESGRDWTFSGKTGSAATDGHYTLAWFVGHVKRGERQYVFACNAASDGKLNGPKLQVLVLDLLKKLDLAAAE